MTFGERPTADHAVGDTADLPPELATLARWLLSQEDVTPDRVAAQFNLDPITARARLEDLVQRGFVGLLSTGEEPHYQARFSREERSSLSANAGFSASAGGPLALVANPSGDYAIAAGQTFELRVTLSNQGPIGAIIDLYIDGASQPLHQWCVAPEERLALSPQQSSEVVFQFPIPVQTLPGSYPYVLVADAPQHYPEETPIRHSGRLQVLPPVQTAAQVNDPTFTLLPTTSVTKPAIVQPGQPFEVRVLVNNRSNRVDRFRVQCNDFPEDWYTIIYPEGLQELGLALAGASLALNPNSRGEILILFNLPPRVRAGQYYPTICLTSANNRDLILIDVVYLEVLPVYELEVELRAILSKVKQGEGLYELRAVNLGNTSRELLASARGDSEEELCTYTLSPEEIQIESDATGKLFLEVKPNKWWYRPWLGNGREFNFFVDLRDRYEQPLPVDALEGTLVWQARPWWQLLLVVITALGAIATLVFLVWWFFFRPPVPPRVLEFSSVSPLYRETDGDAIRLNWQISQPRRLQALRIEGQPENQGAPVETLSYDLSRGLPPELEDFCTLERVLSCANVSTDAREVGTYTFTLTAIAKGRQATIATQTIGPIAITPRPLPRILNLRARLLPETEPAALATAITAPAADEAAAELPPPVFELNLTAPLLTAVPPPLIRAVQFDFEVLNPDQIRELRLVGRSPEQVVLSPEQTYDLRQGLPLELEPYCTIADNRLRCEQLPRLVTEPGSYTFELTVVPRQNEGETPLSQTTDTLVVEQPEPPQVVELSTTQPRYSEAAGESIQLNWTIAQASQLAELRLVGRSPEGEVVVASQSYDFSGGVPEALAPFCALDAGRLTCTAVPTAATAGGDYIFELVAIAKLGVGLPADQKQTALVKILPAPERGLRITAFQLNGRDAPLKYQAVVDPRRPPQGLRLSWAVEGGENVQVSLLPAPGNVAPEGSLRFPLSQQTTQQTVTLQATNAAGEQVQRSLVIETTVLEPSVADPEAVPEERRRTPLEDDARQRSPFVTPPQFD